MLNNEFWIVLDLYMRTVLKGSPFFLIDTLLWAELDCFYCFDGFDCFDWYDGSISLKTGPDLFIWWMVFRDNRINSLMNFKSESIHFLMREFYGTVEDVIMPDQQTAIGWRDPWLKLNWYRIYHNLDTISSLPQNIFETASTCTWGCCKIVLMLCRGCYQSGTNGISFQYQSIH